MEMGSFEDGNDRFDESEMKVKVTRI